jgi:hypothetical protein
MRVLFFFFITLCVLSFGSFSKAISKDAIEVTRDENKTTYAVGPSEQEKDNKSEEQKDKERAWDMLNRMNIIIDKRNQNGQKNGQHSGE